MKKGKSERIWRSAASWRQIVERYEKRDITADEFCRREGVSSSSLWKWQSRLKGSARALNPASFVEVSSPQAITSRSAVELRFPSGIILRLVDC